MNPLTDLSTKVLRPDGSIVEVIQPGARLVRSKNWRLNEDAYRRYEAHIREAIKVWPTETKFAIPNGMSPNTFEHRLRDALQAIKLFGYDADVQVALANIREELVVSMDPAGDAVWIRARGSRGRPVQLQTQPNDRPGFIGAVILPSPDEETVRAYCVLGKVGHRTEPVQFKGRLTATLVDILLTQYDVAFAYDEAADVTTMI